MRSCSFARLNGGSREVFHEFCVFLVAPQTRIGDTKKGTGQASSSKYNGFEAFYMRNSVMF